MHTMTARRTSAALLLLLTLTACSSTDEPGKDPAESLPTLKQITESPTVDATATPTTKPSGSTSHTTKTSTLGRTQPRWLGTRTLPAGQDGFAEAQATPAELRNRRFTLPDTVKPLPGKGFASEIVSPPPSDVLRRSTFRTTCPVEVDDLAWIRVVFQGFDGKRHTGELLVNRAVTDEVVAIFKDLYAAHFPIEEMRITRTDELTAKPTGDGNNTGAFVCRAAVGSMRYSEHAYGLAIDINPFQNPYKKGDLVLPELATSYLQRDWYRPGMIMPGGAAYDAFTSRGWGWGGAWNSLVDYQHFSLNDR